MRDSTLIELNTQNSCTTQVSYHTAQDAAMQSHPHPRAPAIFSAIRSTGATARDRSHRLPKQHLPDPYACMTPSRKQEQPA